MLDSKLFVSRFRAATKAQASLSEKCAELAAMVAAEHNPQVDAKAEYDRLRGLVTETLKAGKIAKPDRNVLGRVYQYLTIQMFPTEVVEIQAGTGKNSAVTKKAEDCTTTREVEKAAKQIKENMGLADGRAGNKKKPKAGSGFDPAVLRPWVKADIKAAVGELTRILAAFGYRVEKIRHTSPPIKKPRTQAETRRPPAAEQPAEQPAA